MTLSFNPPCEAFVPVSQPIVTRPNLAPQPPRRGQIGGVFKGRPVLHCRI